MPKKSKTLVRLIVIFAALLVIVLGVTFLWAKRHDVQRSVERASLPSAVPYATPRTTPPAVATPKPRTTTTPVPRTTPTLPQQANLAVPFTVQAPNANWDEAHGEFCEEASVFMAMSYVLNQDIPTPEFADQKMLAIKAFEEERFGYYKDTTIEETAVIFREHYDYNKLQIIENPTVNDLKHAVAQGQLVVVPAAGRMLGNPYFQQPGPLYHMFVIKGYTADNKFIVNDPGTKRGADFLYTEEVLMNAIHDWRDDRQIELGKKVVLIVG